MMPDGFYYLDHAAATPVDERVMDAMRPYFSERFFNPSSPYAPAVEVRREYQAAKARLAATFGTKADEIIVTAGATESINLAFSTTNQHVVTSAIEHDAVLEAASRKDHTLVQPTEKGIIQPEAVISAMQPTTELVSIQLANNEIGTIQPVRKIAEELEKIRTKRLDAGDKTPLFLHCDASQGFGQIDVHIARLGVDMLTLNAGKMYGPKQVGLLWTKSSVPIESQIVGGGQERGLRSGTENVAGAIGFSVAAVLSEKKRKNEAERLRKIRDEMQDHLTSAFSEAVISGHPKKRLPGSLHMSFPGLDAERLVFTLERRNVFVATGSACAANKDTRSHVLEAIGLAPEIADGSLRITLGRLTTAENAKEATAIIEEEIKKEYERKTRHA